MKNGAKFRAWDFETQRFIEGDCNMNKNNKGSYCGEYALDTAGQLCFYQNGRGTLNIEIKRNVGITHFTGLLDKNNKEIYEGDFVKSKLGLRIVKIGFRKPRTTTDPDNNIYGVYGIWQDCSESYFLESEKDLEVVGNIYENQELLDTYQDSEFLIYIYE